MIALILLGLLMMAASSAWKRVAPDARLRGLSPFWLELLGVGVITCALWRFPMARWIGLAAVVLLLLASGIRSWRTKVPA